MNIHDLHCSVSHNPIYMDKRHSKLGVALVCDLAVKLKLTFHEWRPSKVNNKAAVGTNLNRFWNNYDVIMHCTLTDN
jgi:hypothetical protein